MSAYIYRTTGNERIRIDHAAHGVYIWIADDSNRFRAITIPTSERQAAAQAMAGDRFEIVVKLAEWERELLDKQDVIDPADVRVGDVVSVEEDDGSWMVRGEVLATDQTIQGFGIHVAGGQDVVWPLLTDATVRLLRRAEPDPEQVEALAEKVRQVKDALGPINATNDEIARELIRRDVRVTGGGHE